MPDISQRLTAALADRYRIERELGAGGMATVYLAEDLKHDRKVAIKVLKPELAAVLGAERFVQEIKTTAALQHPNILPLFDSGEAGGFLFYVMPYVEGETLRAKLDRQTQLGVDEAVKLTVEVADALQYAHEHGVVHRDIKPENILIHAGRPMVADFGIALAVSAAAGGRMTETGLSLGTPHYMSPEQATAEKEITARSDVYSLASVLYEMLAGQPPHLGGSAQQIIMKIVTEEAIPVSQHRKSVPLNVTAALAKALEKLPADRFESAKAFAEALTNPGFRVGSGAFAGQQAGTPIRRHTAMVASLGLLALAASAVAGVEWRAAHRVERPDVVRFQLELPAATLFGNSPTTSNLAVSPDGLTIAYTTASDNGTTRVYIRHLDQAAAQFLVGTDGAEQPSFSPDGNFIAYLIGSNAYKIAVTGGTPVPLGSMRAPPTGLTWSKAGLILGGTAEGLIGIPENGGAARIIAAADRAAGDRYFLQPRALPDGERVLLAVQQDEGLRGERLAMVSLADGRMTRFPINVYDPLGVVGGSMVYVQPSGALMAVGIDLDRARITGDPVNLGITVVTMTSGASQAALSPAGTLVYQAIASSTTLGWVDRSGAFQSIWTEPRPYSFPRLSPDGRSVAVTVGPAASSDVWVYELASATPTRLTNSAAGDERPEWSPDGRRVLYRSGSAARSALWWVPVDLSAASTALQASDTHAYFEGVISGSEYLVYQVDDGAATQADVMYRALHGDSSAHPVAATRAVETQARVSPDGKWVAYVSDASETAQVMVRPFPGPGGQVQVSVSGGTEPVWSRDGTRLFYRDGQHMVEAEVTTRSGFSVRSRNNLFADAYLYAVAPHADYDVSLDGKRFLMVKGTKRPELVAVYGWFNELRKQLSGASR